MAETPPGSPLDARAPRRRISRVIDRVADVLGHEATFVAAVVAVITLLIAGTALGLHLNAISAIATLFTFVMVFAVQHTSSRESRALNVKLDELLRVSEGRNELIGAETETHTQLDERRDELMQERP
jgi:low affinity Fe/Cu permease